MKKDLCKMNHKFKKIYYFQSVCFALICSISSFSYICLNMNNQTVADQITCALKFCEDERLIEALRASGRSPLAPCGLEV